MSTPRKQPSRLGLVVAITGLILATLSLTVASAGAAPGAAWTQPSSSEDSVYGSPTGGFLLLKSNGTYLNPVIGSSLGSQSAIPDHDPGVAPVFDAGGDVYRWSFTASGSTTSPMMLEKDGPDGTVLWTTTVGDIEPHELTLGANRDLYASYFSAGAWHLVRLDAGTGRVYWNDDGVPYVPEPTASGVLMISEGRAQPVSSDGTASASVPYSTGATPELYSLAHNDQGDVAVLSLPQRASGSCGDTDGPATLTELAADATQLWTTTIAMAGCIHPTVVALPNGSWAVSDQAHGQIIGISGIDGSVQWTAPTQPEYNGPYIIGVDANGDIYASQNLLTNCLDEPVSTSNCRGERIIQIDSTTGSVATIAELVDRSQPNYMTFKQQMMSPGRDTSTTMATAPSHLYTVEADYLGGPGSFTSLSWSFNGYRLAVGAPYPTPPDEQPAPSEGGTAGAAEEHSTGGGGSGSGGGGGGQSPHGVPIVLVPGLGGTTGQVDPTDASCGAAGNLEYLCSELKFRHPVYVIGARPGGSTAKGQLMVLDTEGDLDTNARILRSFLINTLHEPPLIVGYSMGGLIARIAISRYGVPAAGLLTIGTPHDGSFLADIATGVNNGCLANNYAMCGFWDVLAKAFPYFRSIAASEMTHDALAKEHLTKVTVPVWTLAGTKIDGSASPGYYFPNDLVVGETSAHGQTANLGSQEDEPNLPLYHVNPADLGFLHFKLNQFVPPAENERESSTVVGFISVAANELTTGHLPVSGWTTANMASRHAATVAIASRRNTTPDTFTVKLYAPRVVAGYRPVAVEGLVVSHKPFQAFCGKAAVSPLILPGELFALDDKDMACKRLRAIRPPHSDMVITGDFNGLRAVISIKGSRVAINLRSRQSIRTAMLQLGRGSKTVLHRRSQHYWSLSMQIRTRQGAVLIVRCGGQVYTTSLVL